MNLQENINRIKEVMGINESIIPASIKRRANKEFLKDYITKGELEYPTLCDEFSDGYDYADEVIDYAVRDFLSDMEENNDEYVYALDYLVETCRNIFGQYLIDIYETTCIEYMKEEQNESEITEKCWKGYTQKGMKTMFGKRYPNCVKKKKKNK